LSRLIFYPGDFYPGDFYPGDFYPGDFYPGDFYPGDQSPGICRLRASGDNCCIAWNCGYVIVAIDLDLFVGIYLS